MSEEVIIIDDSDSNETVLIKDPEFYTNNGGTVEMTAAQIASKIDTFTDSTPVETDYVILGGKKKTLISLIASQGAKGDTGERGADGINGVQGEQGIKGDTGMAGANGVDGAQGIQGLKGDSGTNGVDGKDAYQSALDGGYVGTEAQFNADLKAVSSNVPNTRTINNIALNENINLVEWFGFALSGNDTDIVASLTVAKATGRADYPFTITEIINNNGTSHSGGQFIIDIKKSLAASPTVFTSIFSTLLTIDSGGSTNKTAITPYALTTTTFATGDWYKIFITQAGSIDKGRDATIKIYHIKN